VWGFFIMPQRLYDLLDPVVTDLGYELWHLEQHGAGKNGLLRLYIDSPAGIAIEDCEKVSHEVSVVLDVARAGRGRYDLEVSSPGLDRPLVTPAHFKRFIGASARIHLFAPVAGRRKLIGVILAVEDQVVDLGVDDQTYRLPIGDMAKARLEPVFEQ
jgi:ribosome maturation factor RimP